MLADWLVLIVREISEDVYEIVQWNLLTYERVSVACPQLFFQINFQC